MKYLEEINNALYDTALYKWTARLSDAQELSIDGGQFVTNLNNAFTLTVQNVDSFEWFTEPGQDHLLPINVIQSGSEVAIFSVQSGVALSIHLNSESLVFSLDWWCSELTNGLS